MGGPLPEQSVRWERWNGQSILCKMLIDGKSRDDHQNLKLLSIDLNQMHLIGFVERTFWFLNHLNRMFRCKVMAFRVLDFYIRLLEHFKKPKSLRGF